ncbi:MAG: glycoside hydrolase family 16 protein [Jatrophihabitantaceae bacterium]
MKAVPRRARLAGWAAGLVAASLVVGVAANASTTTTTAAASCQAGGYDGATLSLTCQVPQATLTVAGPTVTATATATATTTRTVTATATATVTVAPAPPLPAGWTRVAFFDDFTAGLAKWNVRNNTWASNELSIVTNRPVNVFTDGQVLTLRAQREVYTAFSTTRQYTSAYLDTIGRGSWQYGRFEMRAKLPASKGLWPAFWLRNNTGLGELDIMEAVGGTGKSVQTVHQSTNGDLAKLGHEDAGTADLTAWRVYAVERAPGVIRWFIDDRLVFTVTTATAPWLDTTFNEPMNIRLNLQVGGAMPRWYGLDVDASTVLPADYVIDWVRVLSS